MRAVSSVLALSLLLEQTIASPCSALPIIDLGYVRQQATSYNATTDVYTFSNIRYGQDTTGELRFRAPREPLTDRETVQDGSGFRECPQGFPNWLVVGEGTIGVFGSGKVPFNISAWENAFNETVPPINFNTQTSEDCLFLDVYVPGKVFKEKTSAKAPVLVYIHGGGLVLGSKQGTSGKSVPSGLLAASQQEDGSGMIVVTLNYRLGAFGFLAGPEVEKDGDLNVGLLDQRLALEWVQKHIGQFGGNAGHVTAIGESGGAASILLHMAANGGKAGSTPFHQAILQSSAIAPILAEPPSAYPDFMASINATCLDEARKVNQSVLISANAQQVANADFNTFVYNVVPDGSYVRNPLSAYTKFDPSVKVLVAHNSFEGGIFFDPSVKTEAQFSEWLSNSIAGLPSSTKEYLTNTLYPPIFDGSRGYTDYDTRQMALWGEGFVDCNFLLASSFNNSHTYAYEFSVTPGAHTQDLGYTFNDPTTPPASTSAQQTLQEAIVGFTMNGIPTYSVNGTKRPFPFFGKDGALVNISASAPTLSSSQVNETRCHWWQTQRFV
ncbi:hypothetical protein Trihar35433_6185 [Trichoderma harzianum]|nr:hypothetical protein Trihar35433_6185 [Trichoderma harzianum]